MRRALLGIAIAAPAMLMNCVGDTSSSLPDGSIGPDASDATMGNDVVTTDAGTCTPGCVADASTLRACNGNTPTDTPCNLGCLSTTTAHCGVFNPTGLVEPDDFNPTGLKDFDPFAVDAGNWAVMGGPFSYVFHTDTGQIEDMSNGIDNGTIRPANVTASVMTVDGPTGIGYRLASDEGGANKLGIFVFKDLYLRGGEFHFTGPNPVALVAQQDMLISGVINVADTGLLDVGCYAAAGGGAGAANNTSAVGLGGGGGGLQASASSGSGGGGGGSGGAGAAGGNNEPGSGIGELKGGAGGAPFAGGFDPLLGGGGAGGGGGQYTGAGGAGGGALALFANGTITITQGAGKQSGVNAGGCGAAGDQTSYANGGGGAGGAILVQAPTVIGIGNAGLAANGGSGGCNNTLGGVRGTISLTPAPGTAAAGGACGAGGNGGAGTTAATAGQAPTATAYGGGGGGGVGRIQISTYTSYVVDGGFVLSPPPSVVPLPIE